MQSIINKQDTIKKASQTKQNHKRPYLLFCVEHIIEWCDRLEGVIAYPSMQMEQKIRAVFRWGYLMDGGVLSFG